MIVLEEQVIGFCCDNNDGGAVRGRGFTLLELIVVILIISLLLAILCPVLAKVRQRARTLAGQANQRDVAGAAGLYASDNDEKYPASVATIGVLDVYWHWQEPTRLTGIEGLTPESNRAMSEFLRPYIKDAAKMYCPNAPRKYRYAQQAWDAGDDWDNPDTAPNKDSVSGTYCFWWNYVGYHKPNRPFIGPKTPLQARAADKILLTCYFGYDHWRSPGAFGSCERFRGAAEVPETFVSAAYWAASSDASRPVVKLQAAYMDGHVDSFLSTDATAIRVAKTPDGRTPYRDGVGPGVFFIPASAAR